MFHLLQYINAVHHGYLHESIVKLLLYIQGIYYHLFAFVALFGQRSQIKQGLSLQRFCYYKDNDKEIFFYSPEI